MGDLAPDARVVGESPAVRVLEAGLDEGEQRAPERAVAQLGMGYLKLRLGDPHLAGGPEEEDVGVGATWAPAVRGVAAGGSLRGLAAA
jgi:hypothetical protein